MDSNIYLKKFTVSQFFFEVVGEKRELDTNQSTPYPLIH